MIRMAVVTLIGLVNAALFVVMWTHGCNPSVVSVWFNPFAGTLLAVVVPFAVAMTMAFGREPR